MKIIFMGTPDYAAESLKALLCAGHEITAVVTQPDKKKGRGMELIYSPVKEVALKEGIPVLQPANINTDEAFMDLSGYEADIYVVAAFGQILKERILNNARLGCINVHASLLPRLRGAAPIQKAILDGDSETGVTIMKMDKGLDTGDIIHKITVAIESDETGESLHDKIAVLGGKALVEALIQIEQGTAAYEKQDDSLSTYAGRLDKKMGVIKWDSEASYIERQVRAFYPWPGAFTSIGNKRIKVIRAALKAETDTGAPCGQVIGVNKDSIEVAAGGGSILLLEVLPEGKHRIKMQDFLNGYKVKVGDIIGITS